ncbi:unnamed protein product [Pleuronectes platessa]|uniref:Uncharacterized protein n=1 Tax=Pleuronectes platessa TaxID=8262 RepID=A0A9N7TUH9_PLEPL|nr:unnamed protein product [Pleuronectes platessa]
MSGYSSSQDSQSRADVLMVQPDTNAVGFLLALPVVSPTVTHMGQSEKEGEREETMFTVYSAVNRAGYEKEIGETSHLEMSGAASMAEPQTVWLLKSDNNGAKMKSKPFGS